MFLESLEDGRGEKETGRERERERGGGKKAIAVMTEVPSLEYGEMAH